MSIEALDIGTTQTREKHASKFDARPRFRELCPGRLIWLSAALLALGSYQLLKRNERFMYAFTEKIVYPYHRIAGTVWSTVPFSVAELLYAVAIVSIGFWFCRSFYLLIRDQRRLRRMYIIVLTSLCLALTGINIANYLWGSCYYGSSFEERSGIEAKPVTAAALNDVTRYFVRQVNHYAPMLKRDEAEVFDEDITQLLGVSPQLYENVQLSYPCLEGAALRVKPMVFSRLMSYMNFTGFFFPLTGEANVNIDAPSCLIPATIAHELAHGHGVAAEQEANFVAVLASLESEEPIYCYSASLLAFIHLSNALYEADRDAWLEIYQELGSEARADLSSNAEYWAQFEGKVAEASEAVYNGYLRSQGQELGMRSYGACVDLLVSYYSAYAETTSYGGDSTE